MQLEMYEERLLEGAKLLAQARSVTDEKNMQAVNTMSNSLRGTKRKKSGLNCLFSCSIRQMSDRNWQRMWIITDIMIRRPDIRI